MEQHKIQVPKQYISGVFGSFDANIKKIEKTFLVTVTNRGDDVLITGEKSSVASAQRVIEAVIEKVSREKEINEQDLNYIIAEAMEGHIENVGIVDSDFICTSATGRVIRPKTMGQKKYIDSIRKNTVIFGVGPAGTGKTYLAMAMAITAFKNNDVNRIILTRPAIEAGESLGFLPGDMQQKVDPYLRPLYDALYEIMGADSFLKNMERGSIEVAPLAYMRGRTLDNSFIVLDEAQNTTPEQMKMFLTRIGFGSKAVVTGDITQIDLPKGKKSGLEESIKILEDIEEISVCMLTNKDVVRHPIVRKIINAYEKYEQKQARQNEQKQNRQAERGSRSGNAAQRAKS